MFTDAKMADTKTYYAYHFYLFFFSFTCQLFFKHLTICIHLIQTKPMERKVQDKC